MSDDNNNNNNGDEKKKQMMMIECDGSSIHRQIMTCDDDNNDDCKREYYLYLPTQFCSSKNQKDDEFPIVFVIHCYGCTAERMVHWEKVAEEYNFVLVRPEGLQRSFNAAPECCGYSLQNNINDVEFFQDILQELWISSHDGSFSKKAIYAMGWSNGGYMVTYAAHLFRAIAPIAGYHYNPNQDISASLGIEKQNENGIGLFMHHAMDDPNVRFNGCCSSSSERSNSSNPAQPNNEKSCCCNIDENSPKQCTSAIKFFTKWAQQVNQCEGTISIPRGEVDDSTTNENDNNNNNILISFQDTTTTCYTTTTSCKSNTTLCIYQTGGHFNIPSHEEGFPMVYQVAEFFMKDACLLKNGNNRWENKQCTCRHDLFGGTYCLKEKGNVEKNEMMKQQNQQQNHHSMNDNDSSSINTMLHFIIVGILVMLLLFIIVFWKYNNQKKNQQKYKGYQKTSNVELSSLSSKAIQ